MYLPKRSPWGEVETIEPTEISGVFFLTTPGHGGVAVHRSLWSKLSDEAVKYMANENTGGDYLFFEEDCAWAVLTFEMGYKSEHRKTALGLIAYFYPEYVQANVRNIQQVLAEAGIDCRAITFICKK